jgi:hypothetical protein
MMSSLCLFSAKPDNISARNDIFIITALRDMYHGQRQFL